MRPKGLLVCILFTITVSVRAQELPNWISKPPILPPPKGEIIRVHTADELIASAERLSEGGTVLFADELIASAERLSEGGTVLLEDGEYSLPRTLVLKDKNHIAIRGASGDPSKVILLGNGWNGPERGG